MKLGRRLFQFKKDEAVEDGGEAGVGDGVFGVEAVVTGGGDGVGPIGEGEGAFGHGGEFDFVEGFFGAGAWGGVVYEEGVVVFETDGGDPVAVLAGVSVVIVLAIEADVYEDGGFGFGEGIAGV